MPWALFGRLAILIAELLNCAQENSSIRTGLFLLTETGRTTETPRDTERRRTKSATKSPPSKLTMAALSITQAPRLGRTFPPRTTTARVVFPSPTAIPRFENGRAPARSTRCSTLTRQGKLSTRRVAWILTGMSNGPDMSMPAPGSQNSVTELGRASECCHRPTAQSAAAKNVG